MRLSAPLTGLASGLIGTIAMTLTLCAERRARRHATGPVDYDASPHVVTAASTVLRWTPETDAQRRALFLVVHWGYGSAVGLAYPPLRKALHDTTATAVFYAGCQTMAMTLFPTLGGTPPPWRWKPSILLSSLTQHAVYAATVGIATRRIQSHRHADDASTTRSAG